jgi:hypothetical protein
VKLYFESLKSNLRNHPLVVDFLVLRERIGQFEGFIELRAEIINNYELYVFEYYKNSIISDYRYHTADKQGNLLVRWDNAPHFPKLETYPHHKHSTTHVVESIQPTLLQVLNEISELW